MQQIFLDIVFKAFTTIDIYDGLQDGQTIELPYDSNLNAQTKNHRAPQANEIELRCAVTVSTQCALCSDSVDTQIELIF